MTHQLLGAPFSLPLLVAKALLPSGTRCMLGPEAATFMFSLGIMNLDGNPLQGAGTPQRPALCGWAGGSCCAKCQVHAPGLPDACCLGLRSHARPVWRCAASAPNAKQATCARMPCTQMSLRNRLSSPRAVRSCPT